MSVKLEFDPGINWYTRYCIRSMAEKMHMQGFRTMHINLGSEFCYNPFLNRISIPHNFSWWKPTLEANDHSIAHEFSHSQDKLLTCVGGIAVISVICSIAKEIFNLKKLWPLTLEKIKQALIQDIGTSFQSAEILTIAATTIGFFVIEKFFSRNREEFADKNALKYLSTKEKIKAIVEFTYLKRSEQPLSWFEKKLSTHPTDEKRIEWIKESIGRENLLLRIYAKVLLCFFMLALSMKIFFEKLQKANSAWINVVFHNNQVSCW